MLFHMKNKKFRFIGTLIESQVTELNEPLAICYLQ